MSKEKFIKLNKYAEDLKNKLVGLPEKHKEHPAQYRQFLERELKAVTSTLEDMKLAGVNAPGKK